MANPGLRPRVHHLPCSSTVRASLAHYGARTSQQRHAHDYTQVSFLLSGRMAERLGQRDYALDGVAAGLKPAGAMHEDHWGDEGVLVFSVKLSGGLLEAEVLSRAPGWGPLEEPLLLRTLVRACLAAEATGTREEAICDLLALSSATEPPRGDPPRWLVAAREAIMDAPHEATVEDAARTAGVHRVHFSRMFRRCFGSPPSVYRRRALVARAIHQTVRTSEPLSAIACDQGFSDQPHLTRCVRATTGVAPAALRTLLGGGRRVSSGERQGGVGGGG